MSFDLLVFDRRKVPQSDEEFLIWYEALAKWDQEETYNQIGDTTPKLRKFYKHISSKFPPMNPVGHERRSGRIWQRITAFFDRGKSGQVISEDDLDEGRRTDYSIANDAIYLSFAWSEAEKASRATLDAALKSKVGFWFVSADDSKPLRTDHEIRALRKTLGEDPVRLFSKTNLYNMLETEGWAIQRDPDDGSRSATLAEDGMIVRIAPSIRATDQGMAIDWYENIITTSYAKATECISTNPEYNYFYPIDHNFGKRRADVVSSLSEAKEILEKLVQQLKQTDIQAELQKVSDLPLSYPGNAAIRILAAKACLGEISELRKIRDRMRAGDRQGFVLYIEIDHLENAISVCEEISAFR